MKYIHIILLIIITNSFSAAQNNEAKADDASRIALASFIPDNITDLTSSSKKFLINKLNRITSNYGIGGSPINERFIFSANVEIITKDITPTAPPMLAYTLEVSFYVGDGIDGKLFASTSSNYKGVGETETKAFKAALKNIKTKSSDIEDLLNDGKKKIIEFYNAQCDFILKEAEMLVSQNKFDAAIHKLVGIPEVCKECYDKAMTAVGPIYQKQIDRECSIHLNNARNAWNKGQDGSAAQSASVFLGKIDSNSKCIKDAQSLANQIGNRIKDLDQREWDFKLKVQQDEVDINKATINAVKEIGVAYGKNQPKTVVYKSIY